MEKQGEIKEGLTPPETELQKSSTDCASEGGCGATSSEELEEHLTKRIADKTAECKSDTVRDCAALHHDD